MSNSMLNDICDVCYDRNLKGDVDNEALMESLWHGLEKYYDLTGESL